MPKHPSDTVNVSVTASTGDGCDAGAISTTTSTSVSDADTGSDILGKKRKSPDNLGGLVGNTTEAAVENVVQQDATCANGRSGNGTGTEAGEGMKVIREMDYCTILNRVLPESIRVVGWSEVTDEFSSRFSAAYRTYRYFFTKRELDIAAMNKAAALLVGDHDFRNICKMDVVKISNFRREVHYAIIKPFKKDIEHPDQSVWMLEIRGIAFLWHMVSVLQVP